MCVINVKTYVHPDGRRENVEEKKLCGRSDGVNPCYTHVRQVLPDVFLSRAAFPTSPVSPSLIHDDIPTPLSGSYPATPVSATAGLPRVEIRQPALDRTPSTRDKGKKKAVEFGDLHITFGKKTKKYPDKKGRSLKGRDDDDADIIAAEVDGVVRPTSPTRRRGNMPPPPPAQGLGSPFGSRSARRPPVEVHQSNAPYPPSPRMSGALPVGGGHRRTFTAPEPLSMPQTSHSDNEIWDRAAARERLRQEERDRRRREDDRRRRDEEQRRVQEEADRRLAEHLAAQELEKEREKERRERAEDEFSTLEYERIQGREELRRQARERREQEEARRRDQNRQEKEQIEAARRRDQERREREQVEEGRRRIQEQLEQEQVERLAREVREARERKDREAARRAEERAARLAEEQRREREEARRRERELEADLARIQRRREERQLRETQEEIARLERDIQAARREREARAERERRLEDEIRAAERLQSEIQELEAANLRDDIISANEAEIRYLEEQTRYRDRIDGPRFGDRRNIGAGRVSPAMSPRGSSPQSPVADLLTSRSPLADPNYRRWRGEQVLERERAIGSAQARTQDMQNALGDGEEPQASRLVRRNTVGSGSRARETAYRSARRYYPPQ